MDKAEGIKAIIALQKMVGVDEPLERAEREWDAMSDYDKKNTMAAYRTFFSN